MIYKFEYVDYNAIDWGIIEKTYDSTIYKTKEWFDYLSKWKKIDPFIVRIEKNDKFIGFFVGEKIKRGIRIIGSPFEGIGTAHQGLSLCLEVDASERITIYEQLAYWLFKYHYALFFQVEDWQLELEDLKKTNICYQAHDGYMIDLSLSEEQLFRNLQQKSCRYSINKSIKCGISVRETNNLELFIDTYYDQLVEVFSKQGLKPTYDKTCVESLIYSLYPNRILLLEAVTQDGQIAATGIFPGDKNLAVFWGGASYQRFQYMCPNEPLIWNAIIEWKNRGAKVFDLCGVRPYKLKFGPIPYSKPRLIFAKYKFLITLKTIAKKTYYGIRNFMARFR